MWLEAHEGGAACTQRSPRRSSGYLRSSGQSRNHTIDLYDHQTTLKANGDTF